MIEQSHKKIQLHNLKPNQGAVKNKKRKGRGQGSGKGGTCTKGHKGQQARSGYKRRVGFEGGQLPLIRRIPRIGPKKRIIRPNYKPVSLDRIQALVAQFPETQIIDRAFMIDHRIINKNDIYKILAGKEKLNKALNIEATACSKTAKQIIEEAGGSINVKK